MKSSKKFATILACLLVSGSCVPWVWSYGELESKRHITHELFEPNEKVLVWPIWNDKWRCNVRQPMIMTAQELMEVHAVIKKRRVLGYKTIMPYGGSRHSIQGFLIFAQPDVILWHRFSNAHAEKRLSLKTRDHLLIQLRSEDRLTALTPLRDPIDYSSTKPDFLTTSCKLPISFKGSSDERELSLAFLRALTPARHGARLIGPS